MRFNAQIITVASLLLIMVEGLPLDNRDIEPRTKSYDVINVDGGSSTPAPAQDTTTVKVTATATITRSTTAATTSSPSSNYTISTSRSSSKVSASTSISTPTTTKSPASSVSTPITTATPGPIFITVTVPIEGGPTEYYDDGMWHTRYPIKSFEAAVATSV